jgi:hypothetical protein
MKLLKRSSFSWTLRLVVLVLLLALPLIAQAQAAPTIDSDKDDYAPGEIVTLSGQNWQPGESVHIFVDDSDGQTWNHNADVTAGGDGAFSYQFQLPDWFVATYTVTATGSASGTATTTFTDGNVSSWSGQVKDANTNSPISGATVSCTTTSGCNADFNTTTDANGNYWFDGTGLPGHAAKLTFAGSGSGTLTLTASTQTRTVAHLDTVSNVNFSLTPSCTAPSVTANPMDQSVVYGANASFTAAGSGDPSPSLLWQVSTNGGVSFSDIAGATSSPLTVNTPAVSQSGNKYRAVFTNTCAPGTATSSAATLTVNKANAVISVTGYNVTYDGNAHTATGSATGVFNESLAGLDLSGTTHTSAGSYPTDPWTFTDVTGNYNNASGTVADSIAQAPVTATAGSGSSTYDGATRSPSACAVTGAYTGDLTCANNPASAGPGAGTTVIAPLVSGTGQSNFDITSVDGSYTINKADATCTVTGYSVYYDGNPHTATGSCTGVLSEGLSGLNLSGTSHTNVGSWSDSWTFTDVTGNYNNTSGTVSDAILAWTLSGFYQPVDMMNGTWNTVKGGSTVPLKFEVFAATELTDVAVVSMSARQIGCSGGTEDPVDVDMLSSGSTSLRYDFDGGQFIQNWKTPKQPGKCYEIKMTASDGSMIKANFKLK